jgi:hypothetical protein
LLAAGFLPLGAAVGGYLPGDVIIIDPSSHHQNGHMAMYDGRNWISDFKQKNMLHIYPDQTATDVTRLRYTIYRYGIRWDSIAPPLSANLG